MKFALSSLVFVFATALGATSVFAADPPSSGNQLTPQQQKMVDCNKQAADKKGDEHRAFMSQCLKAGNSTSTTPATAAMTAKPTTTPTTAPATPVTSATPAAPVAATPAAAPTNPAPATTAATSQQDKMRSCNADARAKGLKGDDRRTFMSSCLKGNSTTTPAPAQ